MRSRKTSAAALAVALVLVVALTAVLATNAPGKADRLRLRPDHPGTMEW